LASYWLSTAGSLTAGRSLNKTKTPLTVWFWAAYLMTTDKRGVSALLLQRQLALSRYETAWMMRHKLRRAMVKLAREALRGEVEVDEGVRRPVCREAGNSRAAQRPWSWRPWRNAAVRPDACGSSSARLSQARPQGLALSKTWHWGPRYPPPAASVSPDWQKLD
jgi:hypothetical protein